MDVQPDLLRPEYLWFDDGNIILRAENTIYRLHKSILSAHSEVFRDLFAVAQADVSEQIEGCPVVCIPDNAVEVTSFLRAVTDPRRVLPALIPALTDFLTLYGCMRLSNKYGVDWLHQRALVHLEHYFSQDLHAFDDAWYDPSDTDRPPEKTLSWEELDDTSYLICAIVLFREVGAPWMLPVAFHQLALNLPSFRSAAFSEVNFRGIRAELSPADKEALFAVSEAQIAAVQDLTTTFMPVPGAICPDGIKCAESRAAGLGRARRMWLSRDCLALRRGDLAMYTVGICESCNDWIADRIDDIRNKFWDLLPATCGLSSWQDLAEMKRQSTHSMG
ncbi:hypothetical protein MKEN_00201000 [Mycena kentingensis (nom. inval.)]|nr:hypothetical protein MKEN_00201000 [Mycena kentingensis (nom. inval.)]